MTFFVKARRTLTQEIEIKIEANSHDEATSRAQDMLDDGDVDFNDASASDSDENILSVETPEEHEASMKKHRDALQATLDKLDVAVLAAKAARK